MNDETIPVTTSSFKLPTIDLWHNKLLPDTLYTSYDSAFNDGLERLGKKTTEGSLRFNIKRATFSVSLTESEQD
jgi:hypothetical protein